MMPRNPLMDSYAGMVKFCPEARTAETVYMTRSMPLEDTDEPMTLTVSSLFAGRSSILISNEVNEESEPLLIPVKPTGGRDEGIAVVVQSLASDFVPDIDILSASLYQLGMTLERQSDEPTSTLGIILRTLAKTRPGLIEQRPNYISFTSTTTLVYDNRLLAARALHKNILDHVDRPTTVRTTDHNVYAGGFNKYGKPFMLDAVETGVEQGDTTSETLSILAHTPCATTSFGLDSTTDDIRARARMLLQPAYLLLRDPNGVYTREELIEADAEAKAEVTGDPPKMVEFSKDEAVRRLKGLFDNVYEVSPDPYMLFGTK